jgi:hypothetical protein
MVPAVEHAVVAISPPVTVARSSRRKTSPGTHKPIPPYDPVKVEAFTAVIVALFVAGIIAVACVFPYQGTRESSSDDRRWEVTLARWFAENDFPEYAPLEKFTTRQPGVVADIRTSLETDGASRRETGGIFEAYLRDIAADAEKSSPAPISEP